MSDFVNTVDIIGDEALTNSIIDRSITEIADNQITEIGDGAFQGCNVLLNVDFPAVTSIGNHAFSSCTELQKADFHEKVKFGQSVFYYSRKFNTLILRSETMCTLTYTNAFTDTPIASTTGYIYVPAALVDSYKANTKWATYAAQFRALEDYTVDGTTTGALDETKIAE